MRRREILSLKAEQRRSSSRTRQASPDGAAQHFGELFCGKEASILPSKLRAIVEDNRVLKEKARKMRARSCQSAATASAWQHEVSQLKQQLAESKQALARATMDPDDVRLLQV